MALFSQKKSILRLIAFFIYLWLDAVSAHSFDLSVLAAVPDDKSVSDIRTTAVIPFKCFNDDIDQCLNGFFPPTFRQCVAFGAPDPESIVVDYDILGPGSKRVGVTVMTESIQVFNFMNLDKLFFFVRGARQFINVCESYVSSSTQPAEGVPPPSQVMDELCDDYYDSSSMTNPCARLRTDPRCALEDSGDLHMHLEVALWMDRTRPDVEAARKKICECSCWAVILDVYTPMFKQWQAYDPSMQSRLSDLETMCSSNILASLAPSISESSSTQCASNTISIQLKPSVTIPAGTVITIQGLNGEWWKGGLQLESDLQREVFGSFDDVVWTNAKCTEWCSKGGLCPNSGDAASMGCKALANEAVGMVSSSRCVRWCDEDSRLLLPVQTAVNPSPTGFRVRLVLLNPSYSQEAPIVQISASGPGFYVAPVQASATTPILTAISPPAFGKFSFKQESCNATVNGRYVDGAWRGSCAGLLNSITFSIQPTIDLISGALITLSGLRRDSFNDLNPPRIRDLPDSYSNLVVDSWSSVDGKLILRVGNEKEAISSKIVTSFVLEMKMGPADVGVLKPNIRIDASHGGLMKSCDFEGKEIPGDGFVSNPINIMNLFVTRSIGQSTCFPGECNTIHLTLASNRLLTYDDNAQIQISGFLGLEMNSKCLSE